MSQTGLPKIVAIAGTTASGKTRLGVKLASLFGGEIVSADSRQVYRGMDIGTGKDLGEFKTASPTPGIQPTATTIPYHCIDIADPAEDFDLAKYLNFAHLAIAGILDRGQLPIVVGGSGMYLQALVEGFGLRSYESNKVLRTELESLDRQELYELLALKNRALAEKLNPSDRKNPHRLIRLIEAAGPGDRQPEANVPRYDALVIALAPPREELEQRIHTRLVERLESEDMIGEVSRLNKAGIPWKRLESFGLEYKYISLYLQERIDYDDMAMRLETAIRQFSKRQLTWLKRWERQGRKMHWIGGSGEAEVLVRKFIGQ